MVFLEKLIKIESLFIIKRGKKMLVAGIDEAGRGPAIGPMVLAVACIEKRDEERLLELKVDDSKKIAPDVRKELFSSLQKILSEIGFAEVSAQEIDSLRDRKSLNEIEAMRIGYLLNNLKQKPEIVFIDACDTKQENFGKRVKKYLAFDTIIKSEHKADEKYPVVSAASILAKVQRDAAIEELRKKHGDVGSGYSHDPITIKFLNAWLQKNNSLPEFARKSWETNIKMLDKKFQKKLEEW